MMNRSMLATLTVVGLALAALPAQAQSSRYQSWQDPSASGSAQSSRELVGRLRQLIADAEKARAADPKFLQDLRALADSYDRPAMSTLIDDGFADGDYTANPTWTVRSGKYWVERGYGLRSAVSAQSGGSTQEQPQKMRREDKALAILGAVLGAQTGGGQAAGQDSAADQSGEAMITLDAGISNAFSLRLEMAAWQADGRLEVGTAQARSGDAGYRLAYAPGGVWQVLRVGGRGSAVIETSRTPVRIEDNKVHVVEWTRDGGGSMAVTVDGTRVLTASDRTFRDGFDRLVIVNRAGDFTLRRVTLGAAP